MRPLEPNDPRSIGSYTVLGILGRGGMGKVYLGQSWTGKRVAIKVIRSEIADDPVFRQRFAREVEAGRAISALYTAPIVDADPEAETPWFATTYIEGPSIEDEVVASGPMSVSSVLILAAGLAESFIAIHRAGLVHRDLKPSNVLLTKDGPCVIDFGTALIPDSGSLTQAVIGTPAYMSPEHISGGEVGPASDIFSIGATLAFAATGQGPLGQGTPHSLIARLISGQFDTWAVPEQLKPIIHRCLARDPRYRPSAHELLGILAAAGATHPYPGWYSPVAPTQPNLPAASAPVPASPSPASGGPVSLVPGFSAPAAPGPGYAAAASATPAPGAPASGAPATGAPASGVPGSGAPGSGAPGSGAPGSGLASSGASGAAVYGAPHDAPPTPQPGHAASAHPPPYTAAGNPTPGTPPYAGTPPFYAGAQPGSVPDGMHGAGASPGMPPYGVPGQAAPGHPGRAYPGQPAPSYPGPAYPGQPAPSYPGQAAAAYPGQAGPGLPGQATPAYSGQPGTAYPGQTAPGYPAGQPYPQASYPGYPGYGTASGTSKPRNGLWIALGLVTLLLVGASVTTVVAVLTRDKSGTAGIASTAGTTTSAPASTTAAPVGQLKLSTPDQLAGLTKATEADLQKTADDVVASVKSELDGEKDAVAAFYNDPNGAGKRVLFLGITADIVSPLTEIDTTFSSFNSTSDVKIDNIAEVPAGPLGGRAKCGDGMSKDVTIVLCLWGDNESLGMAIFYNRPATESSALFVKIRGEATTRI